LFPYNNNDTSLDEYLEDVFLEQDLSQETRQRLVLNFTQAALVLQNSSGVYSRKVDYLHSYAYRVQQEIAGNHSMATAGTKSNRQKTGIDADLERLLNHDPHQEFLLLDDVLPMDETENGVKINLTEEYDNNNGTTDPTVSFLSTSLSKRLSLGGAGSGTRTIHSETYSSTSPNPHCHMPGSNGLQVAGQRAWMGMDHDNHNHLRLAGNTCEIQEDGALCLPGTTSMNNRPDSQTAQQGNDHHHLESSFANNTTILGGDVDMPDVATTEYEFGGSGGDAFDDGMMDDDYHDEGRGYHMRDRNNHHSETSTKKTVTFAHDDGAMNDANDRNKKILMKDPWTMMDPHHVQSTKKTRPLRIGKTIVLPKGLEKLPSQYGSGKYKKRVIQRPKPVSMPPPSMATQLWDIQLGKRRAEDISTIPLRITSSHKNEFAYLAVKTAQRRAEQRRQLRKQRQEQEINQVAGEMEFQNPPSEMQQNGFDHDIALDDVDDDDNFGAGGFDFGGVEEEYHDNPLENNTGITLVDDVYPNRELLGTL
jgi:condensin-2 complex subunit H2